MSLHQSSELEEDIKNGLREMGLMIDDLSEDNHKNKKEEENKISKKSPKTHNISSISDISDFQSESHHSSTFDSNIPITNKNNTNKTKQKSSSKKGNNKSHNSRKRPKLQVINVDDYINNDNNNFLNQKEDNNPVKIEEKLPLSNFNVPSSEIKKYHCSSIEEIEFRTIEYFNLSFNKMIQEFIMDLKVFLENSNSLDKIVNEFKADIKKSIRQDIAFNINSNISFYYSDYIDPYMLSFRDLFNYVHSMAPSNLERRVQLTRNCRSDIKDQFKKIDQNLTPLIDQLQDEMMDLYNLNQALYIRNSTDSRSFMLSNHVSDLRCKEIHQKAELETINWIKTHNERISSYTNPSYQCEINNHDLLQKIKKLSKYLKSNPPSIQQNIKKNLRMLNESKENIQNLNYMYQNHIQKMCSMSLYSQKSQIYIPKINNTTALKSNIEIQSIPEKDPSLIVLNSKIMDLQKKREAEIDDVSKYLKNIHQGKYKPLRRENIRYY